MISNEISLESILEDEEQLRLPSFNEQAAWELGSLARRTAAEEDLPIAIRIERGNQILFQSSLKGSCADNDLWLSAKARVARHFRRSSLYISLKLKQEGAVLEDKYLLDPSLYRCKGGAVPLRLKGGEICGILIVSGLKDTEDHRLAMRILRNFIDEASY